jgi:SAM-dependent methyltransferase
MPLHEAKNWYDTPLYYDIVFSKDDALEGAFLLALLERYGPPLPARERPRILEPACGSGRLVLEMAGRGCDVTGFDASAAMLAFARARLARARRRARLARAELARFDVGRRFHLAHCLVNSFKYLLDEASARSHLACAARALVPGGLYAIGIHLTEYGDRRRNRERWVASRDGVSVTCNIQGWPPDRRTRLERVRSRLRVVERGVERRTETSWLFRTYDLREFRRLVASVSDLEHVATFDFGYDVERPRELPDDQLDAVFVLRKRVRASRSRRARA